MSARAGKVLKQVHTLEDQAYKPCRRGYRLHCDRRAFHAVQDDRQVWAAQLLLQQGGQIRQCYAGWTGPWTNLAPANTTVLPSSSANRRV